jgi:hypothetical protein
MTLAKRLQNLAHIWPPQPCPECESRPAIVCIPTEDAPAPDYPEGRCPVCGRICLTVPVLVGVDCNEL